jgi:hypothetical protein
LAARDMPEQMKPRAIQIAVGSGTEPLGQTKQSSQLEQARAA